MAITPRLAYRMLRPKVALIFVIFAVLGTTVAGQQLQVSAELLLLLVLIASWFINATSLNDLADYEVDKINLPYVADRPLVSGENSRRDLLHLAWLSAVVAISAGLLIRPLVGFLAMAALMLNVLYSIPPVQVSHRGLLASVLLPLGYVAVPYLSGILAYSDKLNELQWLLFAALYTSFIGRILLKDFRDIVGDRKFGKRTPLVRYGARNTLLLSAGFWTAGNVLLLFCIPHNPGFIIIFELYFVLIIYGLYRLAGATSRNAQQIVIAAIAKIATAISISLIVVFSSDPKLTISMQIASLALLAVAFTSRYVFDMSQENTARVLPEQVTTS